MKFIWNFIFFGILFYLIWMFFPDLFMTLVSWANYVVSFVKELSISLWEKFQHEMPKTPAAAFLPLMFWAGK